MKKVILSFILVAFLLPNSFAQNYKMVNKRIKQCIQNQGNPLNSDFNFNYWLKTLEDKVGHLVEGAKTGGTILQVVEARETVKTLIEMSESCETLGKIKEQLNAMENAYKEHLSTEEFTEKKEETNMFGETDEKHYFLNKAGAKEIAKQCKKIKKILDF